MATAHHGTVLHGDYGIGFWFSAWHRQLDDRGREKVEAEDRSGGQAAAATAPSTCRLKIAKGGMPPALRGSCDTRDFSPDLQGLPPGGAVFGSGDVIAAERKEVVDLIMG